MGRGGRRGTDRRDRRGGDSRAAPDELASGDVGHWIVVGYLRVNSEELGVQYTSELADVSFPSGG